MANEDVTVDADPEARGILLALLALGDDESALACLDEKRRAACARGWQELLGAKEEARAQALTEWRAEAADTLPPGLARLHPSWIVAALEGEPVRIIDIVVPDLPEPLRAAVLGMPDGAGAGAQPADEMCPMAIKREVAHAAFGSLAPLCESACGPLAEILCGLPFDELLTEATRRGAHAVGQSLAGAPPALRARAMAAAGEPWAQVIGAASAESTSPACRKAAMAHANTTIPDSARAPSERLLHIGLAALKSELVDERVGSVYRVAGRLPAALGRPLIGW